MPSRTSSSKGLPKIRFPISCFKGMCRWTGLHIGTGFLYMLLLCSWWLQKRWVNYKICDQGELVHNVAVKNDVLNIC